MHANLIFPPLPTSQRSVASHSNYSPRFSNTFKSQHTRHRGALNQHAARASQQREGSRLLIIAFVPTDKRQFLESLGSLLASTSSSGTGSVFLTQKTLTDGDSSASSRILIRATNGATATKSKAKPGVKIAKENQHKQKHKIKLATIVETADLESFYNKYADVCKKGMEGLRKRDKKKAKEKAKAAKKKKGNTTS